MFFKDIPTRKKQRIVRFWSREWDLNPRPADYESAALPLSYLGIVSQNYEISVKVG